MWRRVLLVSGIVASALYIGMDLLGAALSPGYSYADQTISELQALGSPARGPMVVLAAAYVVGMLAFAVGLWRSASTRLQYVIAGLVGVYALACIPFAPMHTREVLAAGGGTWSDTMHLVMTAVDSTLLLAVIALGAVTGARTFRVYSALSVLAMLAGGLYTSRLTGAVAANAATPGAGIAERISVFAAMLWLAVFAVVQLRRIEPGRWSWHAFAGRHPALVYFTLTFVVSWGGILVVLGGPGQLLVSATAFESYVWVLPLVLGPALAGLVASSLVDGRFGLRSYARRLVRWRVAPRWYAMALLVAPAYYLATTVLLTLTSAEYAPALVTSDDRGGLVARSLLVAVTGGLFEELGWTGFAVPVLRRRHSALATSLLVGVVWGVWHVVPEALGAGALGLAPYLAIQLVAVVVGLTGFRVLMVWLYERTHSTLLGILMHVSLIASMLMLQPAVSGRPLLVVAVALDVAPWLVVGAVVVLRRLRRAAPVPGWPPARSPQPAL